MIIFCKNCKYINSSHSACKHKANVQTTINFDDYVQSYKQSPEHKNADNNCVDFEATIFYKIKKFLFKSKF